MNDYPKQILSIEQQIQSYKDAGMIISSDDIVKDALTNIGYYRLRGYCYTKYDNSKKKFHAGTYFDDVLSLYQFDTELSSILFAFLSQIEVALRVRLTESLLTYGDSLILNDPTHFNDKKNYWKNYSAICNEIARSNDVFIKHNFSNHNGKIPLWACVEVLSFGTLSRIIKNLETGSNSAFSQLATYYQYNTTRGNHAKPSQKMLTSWIQSLVILRNTCAHNARIYNRSFNTKPEILRTDMISPTPTHCGLYQLVLAMKYLRPNNTTWELFVRQLKKLIIKYQSTINLSSINFPPDWEQHLL